MNISNILRIVTSYAGLRALACAISALIVAIALVSWSPHDPTWFFISTTTHGYANVLGMIGAYSSAVLMYCLGVAAWMLPVLLGYASWYQLFGIWEREWDRMVALAVSVPVVALLAEYLGPIMVRGEIVGGGLVGLRVYQALQARLSSLVIAVTLLLVVAALGIVITRFAIIRWSYWASARSAKVAYIVSGEIMRHAWKSVGAFSRWAYDLWRGTSIAEDIELLFDDEQLAAHHELSGLPRDEFWKDFIEKVSTEIAQPARKITEPAKPTQHKADQAAASAPVSKQATIYRLPDIGNKAAGPAFKAHGAISVQQKSDMLCQKLAHFGVNGVLRSVHQGPVVTLYEYEPTIDSKLSKIIGLEDDLALALQAHSVRIIAPIPGTANVGFEVANSDRQLVSLPPVIKAATQQKNYDLPLAIGVSTTGEPVYIDLAKTPHLLVAGSTGSGKSVALNGMLATLLCCKQPTDMRLVLIDPKRLEFRAFADIPHLLFPVVTESARAVQVLKWLTQEMERRYALMAEVGVRNIGELAKTPERLPYIVVVIDELADLMMTAGKQVEESLARLAQMARACGIHLLVATQRPSVDVITGLIKVNFPSRIAFRVTSKVDSRTILDDVGAERLLGKGDLLFMDSAHGIRRVHGGYLDDETLEHIIAQVKQNGAPNYIELSVLTSTTQQAGLMDDADAELYRQVVEFIAELDEVSISLVQRKFRIGYNRSARLVEQLQAEGKIVTADGGRIKKVVRNHTEQR